jgi:hypothetical protein
MGRIEHTLLDEGRASSPTDLRPSRTPTIPQKLQMFLDRNMGRGTPKDARPGPCLLLDLDHVRRVAFGRVLEPNAQLVLLEDPQPLQLRGYQLQGV